MQGWHLCYMLDFYHDQPKHVLLSNIEALAPYLVHIYALLRHSGVALNCLAGQAGQDFQDFIQLVGHFVIWNPPGPFIWQGPGGVLLLWGRGFSH